MNANETSPRLEDIASVGTRIRWGAILAGGTLALGLYFLLGILGAAVGLSISDRLNPTTLTAGAIIWALVTTCVALFLGGMVASLFTTGENKVEAMLYGVVMWAFLFAAFVVMGAVGIRSGLTAMVELNNTAQANQSWEKGARDAGVSAEQIKEWRGQRGGAAESPDVAAQAEQLKQTMAQAGTRITWYAFIGMWLSMMAAAGGAVVGAGPTFRLVALTQTRHAPAANRALDARQSAVVGNGSRGAGIPAQSESM